MNSMSRFKIPESVLVVVHTQALDVLLIRRADAATDHWQSVTGSKDSLDEPFLRTAEREVLEETGIQAQHQPNGLIDWCLENVYEIYPWWRGRYAPGVVCNTERVFSLCVPSVRAITLNPLEHTAAMWLPWRAAADRCFSPSNAEACLLLPRFAASGSA